MVELMLAGASSWCRCSMEKGALHVNLLERGGHCSLGWRFGGAGRGVPPRGAIRWMMCHHLLL